MDGEQAQAVLTKLETLARPVIEGEGLELYDTEYKRESGGWVVRFFIFRREGGVSIDDCVRISRQLNLLLDVEDVIRHPYNLEVSSPGLTRGLKRIDHYEKSVGRTAKIKTKELRDGRKTFRGVIRGVENGCIVIDEGGGTISLPFDGIAHGRLEIDI